MNRSSLIIGHSLILGIALITAPVGCGTDAQQPGAATATGQAGQACNPDGSCTSGLACQLGVCLAAGPDAGLSYSCSAGQTRGCYDGPAGTEGQGICRAGQQSCEGGSWGSCVGQVLPMTEACDGLDNDCDGSTDPGCGGTAPGDDAGSPADAGVPTPADGAAQSCQSPVDCDDGQACTLDECNGGICSNKPLTGLACNDGQACTHDDVCGANGVCAGTTISCDDDPGPCGAKRSCNGTSECTVSYAGGKTSCSDGSLCTTKDTCDGAGNCLGVPVTSWQRVQTINYQQDNPDGKWGTLQLREWKVNRAVKQIRVSGESDDGGYCYAYWGTGNVAVYRHSGSYGVYNRNNTYYYHPSLSACSGDNPSITKCGCPSKPTFTDDGSVKICQWTTKAGPLSLGTSTAAVSLNTGDVVKVKAQHLIGKGPDFIKCFVDVKCN